MRYSAPKRIVLLTMVVIANSKHPATVPLGSFPESEQLVIVDESRHSQGMIPKSQVADLLLYAVESI